MDEIEERGEPAFADARPVPLDRFTSALFAIAAACALIVAGYHAWGSLHDARSARAQSNEFFVAPNGSDSNPGTAAAPFATISKATSAAPSGSTVLIESGVYHESVQVYQKALTIQPAPGADVVLDGASPVTNWTADAGAYWTSWTTAGDRASIPWVLPDNQQAGWPEMVFRNGDPLDEVATRGELAAGTFFHDTGAKRIWVADDPGAASMEISDLEWGVYLNDANGSTLRDVVVRRYATPKKSMGAVRAYGNDLLIEGVIVEFNAFAGISAIGDDITLRGVVAENNGQNGLHGHFANNLLVDGARVVGNNRERFDPKWASGGVKVTTSPGFVFQNSYVADNFGPGVWTDLEVRDGAIVSNLFENNSRSAIEIELSAHMVLANNVALNNGEAGAYILESSDIDVWNNGFFENEREIRVFEGNRDVPANRDPRVEWEVRRVNIGNNALGPSNGEIESVQVGVDGSLPVRPTGDIMDVTSDTNRFWRRPSGGNLSSWTAGSDDQPRPSSDLVAHQRHSGQDANSLESLSDGNPLVNDPAANDFRVRAEVADGDPIPDRVLQYLPNGSAGAIVGPLTVSPQIGPPVGVDRTPAGDAAPSAGVGTGGTVVINPSATSDIPSITRSPAGATPIVTTNPFRLFDTRSIGTTDDGQFAATGPLAANSDFEFQVAGRGPVPGDAEGVVVNVTSVRGAADGSIALYPCGANPTAATSLSYTQNVSVANAAIVSLSSGGTVCARSSTATEVIIDMTGYVPAGSSLATFNPVRLVDTRTQGGRLAGGSTVEIPIAGSGTVSSEAAAASLNITALNPARRGFVTAYPCDQTQPLASSLNYTGTDAQTASLELAQLGGSGSVCLFTSADTDLLVDISGYVFASNDLSYVSPARILDTRGAGETADNQYAKIGKRADGFVLQLDVAGRVGVPTGASTALLSVTVVQPDDTGFVTLYPCGEERPFTANLVYAAGAVVNAYAVAAVGDNGQVCVFNSAATEVIVDVTAAL